MKNAGDGMSVPSSSIDGEFITIDDTEELVNQIEELPETASTEEVQENNITPKTIKNTDLIP